MACSPASPHLRACLALVVWLIAVGAAVAGLHAAGAVLPGPPPAPSAWATWATRTDPLVAAFAVLRLVAVALAWWVVASTLLAVGVRVARLGGTAVAAADRLALPVARRLVHGALGAGLVVTTLAGPVGPVAAAPAPVATAPPHVAPPSPVPPVHAGVVVDAHGALAAPGTATLRHLPAGGDTGGTAVLRRLPAQEEGAAVEAPPAPAPATRAVGPGEHCWAVAESALAEAWGRAPTDAEIAPYWAALVELNRPHLPDPANPDLVFPGQVLRLPPLPG